MGIRKTEVPVKKNVPVLLSQSLKESFQLFKELGQLLVLPWLVLQNAL